MRWTMRSLMMTVNLKRWWMRESLGTLDTTGVSKTIGICTWRHRRRR